MGRGRPRSENPSKEALYLRQYRADKKSGVVVSTKKIGRPEIPTPERPTNLVEWNRLYWRSYRKAREYNHGQPLGHNKMNRPVGRWERDDRETNDE